MGGQPESTRVPAQALRILVIDDSAEDCALVARALSLARVPAELTRVDSRERIATALEQRWDVVLVDQNVPGLDAAQVLAWVRARQGAPCVAISGVEGEQFAVAALKRGACDFVTKQNLGRLPAIVERELAEAEARREAARTRAALGIAAGHLEALEESMPDRLFAFDQDGRVVRASGPVVEGAAAVAEERWRALAEPALQACLAKALAGKPASHEWSTGAPGQERWFEARVRPVVVEGATVGAVAAVRDVSELKTLSARLAIADRMAAIGSVAAGVAHDLSTPVAATLASLEDAARLARDRAAALGEDGAALARALADAREAAEQIRNVARDLRTFSRDDAGATADVGAVLDSAARMAAHELRGRARVVRAYGPVPPVSASASRLGQVFLNLIVNAAQSIRPGAPERNEVRLRTGVAPDGRVAVEVEDTGAGMPPEVRRRLFSPFFTTKPDGIGTGLGLSICHRILEGLGGEIEVSSLPGRGTTFRVLLPASRAAPPPPAQAPAAPAAEVPAARARVLVIDDEESVHRAMTRLLGRTCDVCCADAHAALRRLEGGERFDLVLCDVAMAGISGIELHGRVKALDPEQAARIVFLSGGVFGPEAKAFFSATGAAVLDKGSHPDQLRAAIDGHLRALGRRGPRA